MKMVIKSNLTFDFFLLILKINLIIRFTQLAVLSLQIGFFSIAEPGRFNAMEEKDRRISRNSDESVSHEQQYRIENIVFLVQPKFKNSGTETLGTVLLKLMRSETDHLL